MSDPSSRSRPTDSTSGESDAGTRAPASPGEAAQGPAASAESGPAPTGSETGPRGSASQASGSPQAPTSQAGKADPSDPGQAGLAGGRDGGSEGGGPAGGGGGGGDDEGSEKQPGWFTKFLYVVEWLGNLLPHPVTLFAIFCVLVVLISGLAGVFDLSVPDPRPEGTQGRAADGVISARSLMTGEGVRWMVENLVSNFVGFVPLGTVLVALLGVGIAEKSGLLSAVIRALVLNAPKNLVTFFVVFAGVLSNTASEMGYVVLIPLAAAIFHSLGRHPFAGLAAAFAGVSGGYSANLLIGTIDPLLAGITEEAARLIDPQYVVHPAVNWFFMITSTFFITIVGTLVTAKVVEPKLGRYDDSRADKTINEEITMAPLTGEERKGLRQAGIAAALIAVFIAYLGGPQFSQDYHLPEGTTISDVQEMDEAEFQAAVEEGRRLRLGRPESNGGGVPDHEADGDPEQTGEGHDAMERPDYAEAEPAGEDLGDAARLFLPVEEGWRGAFNGLVRSIPGYGVLRNPETGDLLRSPFLGGVVAFIFIFFGVPGYVYGRAVGVMRTDRDVINAMADAMSKMGLYIVLVFFAAQFVAFFGWTNLGQILAVVGADAIRAMNLDNPLVFIPFILMCCVVNLMLGSASAQWAVTAPIFVPMLMMIGYSPEVIQAAYRIGDSTTNIITPMMSYFGIIFAFACRYDRKLGIGTLISTMLPYSIFFLLGWIVLFYVYVFLLGLPVGPGSPTLYPAG